MTAWKQLEAECLERFLRYVGFDTQSDPESSTYPSTAKQLILLETLAEELREMGASEVVMQEHGYVMAKIPATVDVDVPAIGFIAHVDTSPDMSGANVRPLVHKSYAGQDIVLPDDPSAIIRFADNPHLVEQIGNDIVTASGLTLLGADNKAGVAEIMTAADHLLKHPEIAHGTICIAFTPDEEIGGGTTYFDIEAFGANYAYTVDSETLGQLDSETFSADALVVAFQGFNTHPGYAKGTMVNAIKVAADFIARLPRDCSPETTEKREGFVHPVAMDAGVDRTTVTFILRDFEADALVGYRDMLQRIAGEAVAAWPGSSVSFDHREQYRNMREVLEQNPKTVSLAREAIRRAGLEVREDAIRGGTDGSQLSQMGLPTPNIFAGEHNYHSRLEWVSVQDMGKSVEVIVNLCELWGAG